MLQLKGVPNPKGVDVVPGGDVYLHESPDNAESEPLPSFPNSTMDLQLPSAIEQIMTAAHPVLMWLLLGLALFSLKLGVQVRNIRFASGEQKKQLIAARPARKHFVIGSVYLFLIVVGTLGGMAVTYINNGKLFVGAHLIAGLGMMTLVVLAASLSPMMQQGKDWARNLHIAVNVAMLGIFGWQAVTGMQIVQKIFFS